MILGRDFLSPYHAGWVFAELGFLRDELKRIMRDYMDPHFFLHFLFYQIKREREWEESDSCDIFPRKHKQFRRWWWFELRWWWFDLRWWRLQLQRWWFELWWCFDLVFSFYYTQLWIALSQCDISCLSWLVLFSVLWIGVFLKLNLVTMVLFRRKVSCISYNLAKQFTIFLQSK